MNKLQEILNRHHYMAIDQGYIIWTKLVLLRFNVQKSTCRKKNNKETNKVTSAERVPLITVCCIIDAFSQSIPSSIIFPRVNYKNRMLNEAPSRSLGLATSSS